MKAVEANVDGPKDKIFNQSKGTELDPYVSYASPMCFFAKNPVMYQCNSSVQCVPPEYFFIRPH
jgi:hypothetical protein